MCIFSRDWPSTIREREEVGSMSVPARTIAMYLGPAYLGPAYLGPAYLAPAYLAPAYLGPRCL